VVVSGMEARRVWDANRDLRARRDVLFAWRKVMTCNLVDAGVGGRREAYLTGPAFLRTPPPTPRDFAGTGLAMPPERVEKAMARSAPTERLRGQRLRRRMLAASALEEGW